MFSLNTLYPSQVLAMQITQYQSIAIIKFLYHFQVCLRRIGKDVEYL